MHIYYEGSRMDKYSGAIQKMITTQEVTGWAPMISFVGDITIDTYPVELASGSNLSRPEELRPLQHHQHAQRDLWFSAGYQ